MSQFAQQPTPAEILVDRVRPLRFAEVEGRLDATLAQLNGSAAKELAEIHAANGT